MRCCIRTIRTDSEIGQHADSIWGHQRILLNTKITMERGCGRPKYTLGLILHYVVSALFQLTKNILIDLALGNSNNTVPV